MKKSDCSILLASLGLLLPQCHAFQVRNQSQNRRNHPNRRIQPTSDDGDDVRMLSVPSSAVLLPSSSLQPPTSSFQLYSTATGSTTSEVAWNPAQASEFLSWHSDDPEKAGKQLAPMIQHWGGNDVGEFLTRMYLGEVNQEDYTISYHPSNVRNPQWLGLGEAGLRFIALFFREALPPQTLEPQEITRFAEYFLLKEHKWPSLSSVVSKGEGVPPPNGDSSNGDNGMFESDTFMKQGHGPDIARVFGYLRRERLGDFLAEDVIDLIDIPEQPDKNQIILRLGGSFFVNLGIQLTSMEKIVTVEGLALQGCSPGLIARLVSSMEEIGEDVRLVSLEKTKALREAAGITTTRTTTKKNKASAKKNGKTKSKEFMSESISAPVKTPLSEIVTRESESVGLGDFEARWLPDELLEEEKASQQQQQQQ
mmetsp:Transcript_25582/g.62768  ORF Transcript_25582/g.62768 Transcript_25582/m.62768 type:complete len:423 (-) Transcript_25582:1092-2360(-)